MAEAGQNKIGADQYFLLWGRALDHLAFLPLDIVTGRNAERELHALSR